MCHSPTSCINKFHILSNISMFYVCMAHVPIEVCVSSMLTHKMLLIINYVCFYFNCMLSHVIVRRKDKHTMCVAQIKLTGDSV